MIKIRLFCNLGMSTSMLVKNMQNEADDRGLEVEVDAKELANIELEGLDVALLGPQVSYKLDEVRKLGEDHGVIVDVIPLKEYGMMDGKGVLDQALRLYEENQE